MKIKQKILALSLLPFFIAGFTVIMEPTSVQALGKQACINKYKGVEKTIAQQSDFREYKQQFQADKCGRADDGPCNFTSETIRRAGYKVKITCEGQRTNNNPGNGNNNGNNGNPPVEDVDACETETSIIPVDCRTGGNPIWGLLLLAINILTAGIGIVAIGGIVYAAILWTTAEDKNAQIVKSKETIFNVVVGLVAFALLWAFLQFLIPGGVFSQ